MARSNPLQCCLSEDAGLSSACIAIGGVPDIDMLTHAGAGFPIIAAPTNG